MSEMKNLRMLVGSCYSEWLVTGGKSKDGAKEEPDAGLGMVWRYPGDAKKLRDRSKMRLWAEYLRGSWWSRRFPMKTFDLLTGR